MAAKAKGRDSLPKGFTTVNAPVPGVVDSEHADHWLLAQSLYESTGIPVTNFHKLKSGKGGYLWEEGGLFFPGPAKAGGKAVQEGLVVDAWLGNNLAFQKIVKKSDGEVVRAGMRSALAKDAAGRTKDLDEFAVEELDIFLDPETPQGAYYGKVPAQVVVDGIDRVSTVTDEMITAAVDALGPRDSLERVRLKYALIGRRNQLAKLRPEYVAKAAEELLEKTGVVAGKDKRAADLLPGKAWKRVPTAQKRMVLDQVEAATDVLNDPTLLSSRAKRYKVPGAPGFAPDSYITSGRPRDATSASNAVWQETQPDWIQDVWRSAADEWSSSNKNPAAGLFHNGAIRFGLTDPKHTSIRAVTSGESRLGAKYIADWDTGEIRLSYGSGQVVGTVDEAFAAFYGHTQAMLKAQGVEKVRAYRGLKGEGANALEEAIQQGVDRSAPEALGILQDPAASWTESPDSAQDSYFSRKIVPVKGKRGFAIMTREADVSEIIADRRASPYDIGLSGENEFILAGNNRVPVATAFQRRLGKEFRGKGHSQQEADTWLVQVINEGEEWPTQAQIKKEFARRAKPLPPGTVSKKKKKGSTELKRISSIYKKLSQTQRNALVDIATLTDNPVLFSWGFKHRVTTIRRLYRDGLITKSPKQFKTYGEYLDSLPFGEVPLRANAFPKITPLGRKVMELAL